MNLVYLEARKGVLRRSVLLAIVFCLCLDVLKILQSYQSGAIREVVGNTQGMQAGFSEIYDKVKGPITQETAGFLVGEYRRLSQAVADGTYSRKPQDGTYSGYIFGDYYLIASYLYPQMSYCVRYHADMAACLEREANNLELYRAVGNAPMAAKSAYILDHYGNRSISSFYLTDCWESLLKDSTADALILLLLILGVSTSFTRERETGMEQLLASSHRGIWPTLASKCIVAVVYSVGLSALFACVNLSVYGGLFGFQGLNLPLYAIEACRATPFDGTIGQFFLLSWGMKAMGFASFSLVLLVLSASFRRSLIPCIFGAGTAAASLSLAQWAASPVWWKGALAALSPLSLTKTWDLWRGLCGDSLAIGFLPRVTLVLFLQFALAGLLLWGLRRKTW